jgi:signal transduction histidine kinase
MQWAASEMLQAVIHSERYTEDVTVFVCSRAMLVAFAVLMPIHLPFFVAPATETASVLGVWARPRHDGVSQEHVVTRIMWPASASGLLPGDVILAIDDEPISPAALARLDASDRRLAQVRFARNGVEQVVAVPRLGESTFSYRAYRWYRAALAVCAWLIGLAIVTVRGGSADALLLGAVLLLLGPVTVPVAIPDRGALLAVANYVWQLAGAGYRFLLPLLTLVFLLRHSNRRQLVQLPAVRGMLVLVCIAILVLITDAFRSPLDWAGPGFGQDTRAVAGLVAELVALAGLIWIRTDLRQASAPLRWLAFTVVLVLVSGTLLSLAMVFDVAGGRLADSLRQVKALALAPLPVTVMLYFLVGHGKDAGENWQLRRHASAFVYALFLGLYGFAVVGAAAVALSTMGRSLGGAEASLFAAIFFATIVFSPVLRWAREAIDRRVFARWMVMERQAHALVDELNASLALHNLASRLGASLPEILNVRGVRLILSTDLAADWNVVEEETLALEPRASIERRLGHGRHDRPRLISVCRPGGELMGAIEYRLADGRRDLTPPELTALHAIAQGTAVALRNTESHVELERATRDLAESERIASLGAMACGLAHEIKNPLASLKMGLYLMSKGRADAERLQRIERDVRRIDDLVSSLFRFARNADREPRVPIDIRPPVCSAVEDLTSLARDRDVRVTHTAPPDALVILGGNSEIRVLVSNLLRNSLDASNAGGHVRITVDSTEEEALIELRDDGPGIPAHVQSEVFDMNYSTKGESGGLGLALARREAEWLGGRIELQSAPGEGTTLRVRLPRAAEGSLV